MVGSPGGGVRCEEGGLANSGGHRADTSSFAGSARSRDIVDSYINEDPKLGYSVPN